MPVLIFLRRSPVEIPTRRLFDYIWRSVPCDISAHESDRLRLLQLPAFFSNSRPNMATANVNGTHLGVLMDFRVESTYLSNCYSPDGLV